MPAFTEQVSITDAAYQYAQEIKNTHATGSHGQRIQAGNSPTTFAQLVMDKDGAHRFLSVDGAGNVMVSDYQLPTDAVSGFLCIPQCAGAPTGTPNKQIAAPVPMLYDVSNNKLWIYGIDGIWRSCQFS